VKRIPKALAKEKLHYIKIGYEGSVKSIYWMIEERRKNSFEIMLLLYE
jgi:hypothetical protein